MRKKISNPRKPTTVKNMSPKAITAARAFKGLSVAKTPAKLKGKRTAAIKRAVRDFYLG